MKKRVRVYKPKQQLRDGGPTVNNTQDSKLDPIPQQRTNSFISWLQNSAVLGAEREQKKQFEKYMKEMAKGNMGIPMAQNGIGNTMLSPGSTLEYTMKEDPYLDAWKNKVIKDQQSTEEFKGNLGTLAGAGAGILSQPDVWKYEGDTVNPFEEGVDMTGMEITGIEEGKNKRHRTMKYTATGTPSDPTVIEEETAADSVSKTPVNWSTWEYDKANRNLNLDNQGVFNKDFMQVGGEPCPAGYKKDYKGQCVNQITGEPYFGSTDTELENPGLENPFARKANPLTGETPLGFDSTGEKYFNEGIQFGDSVENPDLMANKDLETEGELDLTKQSKLKTFDENNPFVKGEAIPAAMNAIAWLGEGDERRQNAIDFRKRVSNVENIYKTAGADRGDRMANVPGFGNELKPDQHTLWGRDTKVAQDGMEVNDMKIGDEAEMSDEEIQRLLAQGYKLEYIN
jgi:hypothetical protein